MEIKLMAETVRFQVEMDQEQMEVLEELLKLGGLKTKRDLLNNALTLLKWAARERSKGNSVCSVTPNGQLSKELEMPFLETIAVTVQRAAAAAVAATRANDDPAPDTRADVERLAASVGTGTFRLVRGS
jgi:TRAP-type C4-dicarboxylate transport system substrate-binding protein